MTPLPLVTRSTTSSEGGFASSRFGPTVPLAPASLSVWQLLQPAVSKTCLPAAGSPFASGVVGTVPTTVSGAGDTVLPPQPASTSARAHDGEDQDSATHARESTERVRSYAQMTA